MKANVKARLEFELAYIAVQYVSHYAMETTSAPTKDI